MTPMPFSRPVLDEKTKIDFYASSGEALKTLKPVYDALPKERQGIMYQADFGNYLPGDNPLVISNPQDLSTVFYAGEERCFIFVEATHYKQTRGLLAAVSLFLCKDRKDLEVRKAFSEKYQQVILFTTPKSIAEEIVKFIIGVAPKHRDKIGKETIGIVYMSFGEKAASAVKRSVATLKRIGYSYPVCVVGDVKVDGFQFIPWKGESPFDPSQRTNFQFRAGRIKPKLYDLSPFDRTLYIDADTEFVQDIQAGFELLDDYDIALTQEVLKIGELYNKFMAGWEINIKEQAQTIKELDNANEYFINSGVIFFKKNKNVKRVFENWHRQWMRFQQWDEQLALVRAVASVKDLKVKRLPVDWNDPQSHENTIIFHNYGRGNIRVSV